MTTTASTRERIARPAQRPRRYRSAVHRFAVHRLADHRPFLLALALGALVRLVVTLAFTPSLMVTDSPSYLRFTTELAPLPERPVGYGVLLLYPLSWFTDSVAAVAAAQHVLGLGTAVVLYLLLRRWSVGPRLAAVATLPVLLDGMQLLLEHTPLSDTVFVLLVTLGVVTLGWRRRPTLLLALVAGLLLGTSVTVRQVGLPLVVAGAGYCLLAARGGRGKAVTAAALVAGFALPVASYAGWYHQVYGVYALTEIGGKSAYMRATSFVDCDTLEVPDYQRVLCPPEPLGERLDPTTYGWHDPRTVPRLEPPPGTTPSEAMAEFGAAAVRSQPLDYAGVVLRDFALNFDIWRGDRFEYERAYKWRFSSYVDDEPTDWTRPAYAAHGGEQMSTNQPFATAVSAYQRAVYTPGPVLLACLLVGLAAGAGLGRARRSGMRSICLLMVACGAGLMLVPDVTTQFVWRYQLPALVLLPAAGALGLTALRRPQPGTRATPSTD